MNHRPDQGPEGDILVHRHGRVKGNKPTQERLPHAGQQIATHTEQESAESEHYPGSRSARDGDAKTEHVPQAGVFTLKVVDWSENQNEDMIQVKKLKTYCRLALRRCQTLGACKG